MTDSSPQTAPQPAQIQVGLGAQYIKDFSFENPNAPQIFGTLNTPPQLLINVDVMSRAMGEGAFEVVLKLKIESKLAEKTAFIGELAYAGLFSLPPQLPEEQLKLFLMVEAPRLLFPFARALLANVVRDAGYLNIAIQPINFMALYESQRANIGNMVAAGVA